MTFPCHTAAFEVNRARARPTTHLDPPRAPTRRRRRAIFAPSTSVVLPRRRRRRTFIRSTPPPTTTTASPRLASPSRIEFGCQIARRRAGSYRRSIVADDQNQYAERASGRAGRGGAPWQLFIRQRGPCARFVVRLFPLRSLLVLLARSCRRLFGPSAERTALASISDRRRATRDVETCRQAGDSDRLRCLDSVRIRPEMSPQTTPNCPTSVMTSLYVSTAFADDLRTHRTINRHVDPYWTCAGPSVRPLRRPQTTIFGPTHSSERCRVVRTLAIVSYLFLIAFTFSCSGCILGTGLEQYRATRCYAFCGNHFAENRPAILP